MFQIDRRSGQDRLETRAIGIRDASSHQRSAPSDTFCIGVSIFLRNARLSECAHDAAGCGTSSSTRRSGCEPTSCYDRTEARNCQQAEAREQSSSPTHSGSNSCTGSSSFSTIVNAVAVQIDSSVLIVPAVRVVCDDADI
jgi:hypothetical protein